ncbi:MAG: hypothetical protein N2246_07660, partial [Candidatus Sumerlaeia bacterium]|nr:hypothetical protein [Candidatus Sumerlaeia bacterium]
GLVGSEMCIRDSLGSVLAPAGNPNKPDVLAMEVELIFSNGTRQSYSLKYGEIKLIVAPVGEKVKFKAIPTKFFDLGAGRGKETEGTLQGGVVGIILDARGRPLMLPADKTTRLRKLKEWFSALNLYPE